MTSTADDLLRGFAAATATAGVPDDGPAELDRILAAGAVRAVFQPIVELERRQVVGYEALARGPEGSPLERPDLLFAVARRTGRLVELDWVCRLAALTAALDGGLRRPLRLFVNVEPDALGMAMPAHAEPIVARAREELDLVVELTERSLADRPADVLAIVAQLHAQGLSVALDDVGADPRSLALMPFVRPEIIKLDLRLVQARPSPEIAAVVHAVNAHAERDGALVLAEGIETEAQHRTARSLGARYGQGWLYGRPGPLPAPNGSSAPVAAWPPPRPREDPEPAGATPFAIVREHHAPRRGDKRLLLAISRHLELQVDAAADATVVLATFQDAVHFTRATRALYARLASSAALVGALGVGLDAEPAPGVRGASLEAAETLHGEWNVIVIDPHFAAAFVGLDCGDTAVPDLERRFDFCLTYDRDLVVRAARTLMTRLAPARA